MDRSPGFVPALLLRPIVGVTGLQTSSLLSPIFFNFDSMVSIGLHAGKTLIICHLKKKTVT